MESYRSSAGEEASRTSATQTQSEFSESEVDQERNSESNHLSQAALASNLRLRADELISEALRELTEALRQRMQAIQVVSEDSADASSLSSASKVTTMVTTSAKPSSSSPKLYAAKVIMQALTELTASIEEEGLVSDNRSSVTSEQSKNDQVIEPHLSKMQQQQQPQESSNKLIEPTKEESTTHYQLSMDNLAQTKNAEVSGPNPSENFS